MGMMRIGACQGAAIQSDAVAGELRFGARGTRRRCAVPAAIDMGTLPFRVWRVSRLVSRTALQDANPKVSKPSRGHRPVPKMGRNEVYA